MKNQIIYIGGAFLLMSGSMNVSYASSNMANHNMASMDVNTVTESTAQKIPKQTIKLDVIKIEDKGDKKLVQIKLSGLKDNIPITLDNLKEMHTQKIHLLIIDDALEDYSHIHPKALKALGLYEFEWKPKKQANYRIWADLFPLNIDAQEYVIADLVSGKDKTFKINRKGVTESSLDGYNFKLSFDNESIVAGKPVMAKITLTNTKGNPIKNLEPIMGAFAHIVGFSDDFKTVVHVHPMGKEPSKSSDKGGPELEFHIEPEKAGFIKLFAQVKINGKELFVPFGINIK